MRLLVNRVAHPVTALGPGRRLGLWVQGCHIGCRGCAAVDTWDPTGGYECETGALAEQLAEIILRDGLTGISLTGGEPTEQAPALASLVLGIRGIVSAAHPANDIDVLMFTGLTAKAAQRRADSLWASIDAAICGPYRANQPSSATLIASANQRLVTITPLGEARYAELDPSATTALQLNVSGGEVALIGLPGPGDLDRIEAALLARGVAMGGVSWRTP